MKRPSPFGLVVGGSLGQGGILLVTALRLHCGALIILLIVALQATQLVLTAFAVIGCDTWRQIALEWEKSARHLYGQNLLAYLADEKRSKSPTRLIQ